MIIEPTCVSTGISAYAIWIDEPYRPAPPVIYPTDYPPGTFPNNQQYIWIESSSNSQKENAKTLIDKCKARLKEINDVLAIVDQLETEKEVLEKMIEVAEKAGKK